MQAAATMEPETFQWLQSYIHRSFGIFLAEHKRTMLESRLRTVVARRGLPSFKAYIEHYLKGGATSDVLDELVNVVSTNLTYFNREPIQYDLLRKALPGLAERAEKRQGRKELRAWCGAASKGHEPYTLAMILADHFGPAYGAWDAGLLATDISDSALGIARQGVYSHEETAALPERLRKRHMKQRADGKWEVSPSRKQEVVFRRFNLKNRLPFKRPFDFVFLRNVMIYFDNETRGDIATRIGKMLYPEGLLFIGLSESLPRNLPGLEAIGNSMYRRKR